MFVLFYHICNDKLGVTYVSHKYSKKVLFCVILKFMKEE